MVESHMTRLTDRNDEAVELLQKGLKHREIAFGLNDKESFM